MKKKEREQEWHCARKPLATLWQRRAFLIGLCPLARYCPRMGTIPFGPATRLLLSLMTDVITSLAWPIVGRAGPLHLAIATEKKKKK